MWEEYDRSVSGTVSSGQIAVQEQSVTGGGSRAGAKQEQARSRKSLKFTIKKYSSGVCTIKLFLLPYCNKLECLPLPFTSTLA